MNAIRMASLVGLLGFLAVASRAEEARYVSESARQLPVAANVDVVVVGGSSGAVAAAAAAAKTGAKVFLMAPRNYLGEDLAGTMRLWLEPGETPDSPLARKLYAKEAEVGQAVASESLPFTYTTDKPAGGRHPDSKGLTKLRDGAALSAQTDSVEYAEDVTITADLGVAQKVSEAQMILFQRAGDFQAQSVTVQTSADGKTWSPATALKCPGSSLATVAAPVNAAVRQVRFAVKFAPGAKRLLIAEIVLAPQAKPKPAPSGAFATGPIRPMHIKKTLDDALLAAGVQFLFGCYPSDVLRDEQGNLCGVVMANRSGRQAVVAKTIIDASEHGVVARLAGAEFEQAAAGPVEVKWITIAENASTSAGVSARKLEMPLEVYEKKGESKIRSKAAWYEYTLKLDLPDESWAARAALEQKVRDMTFVSSQIYAADLPFIIPPAGIKGEKAGKGSWPGAGKVDLGVFRAKGVKRLWVLSGLAGVPRDQAARLLRPLELIMAGTRVGRAAAEGVRRQKSEDGIIKGIQVARGGAGSAPEERTCEVKEPLEGLRPNPKTVRVAQPAAALPVLGSYDVVVVGGGTAGAPAGIGAARRGARTLVIEYLSGLGGVGTLGMIGTYYHGNRVGFTATVPDFPIETRMEWYRRELRRAGSDIWFETMGCGALTEGNKVTGVIVATPYGRGVVLAKSVVDATGNADIAIQAGADYVFVEDDFALQNSHVPLREVGASYMNGNRPATSDHDPLNVRTALLDLHKINRETFDWGQIMASRERRRIVGDATVDWLDVFNTRTYPDSITLSKSNYDSHGYQIHPYFMLRSFNYRAETKTGYQGYTPYRALLPKGVEGILVGGLAMSAHRDAMPILRMQPDLHNQGYAAGAAAAMAAQAGVTPRQIDVKALQKHLVEIGNLDAAVLTHGDSYPLPKEKIAAAAREVVKDFTAMGVLLAQPEDALPILRQAYAQAEGAEKAAYAEALGVMGDASGLETLQKEADRLLRKKDIEGALPVGGALAVDPLTRVAWGLGGTHDRRAVPMLCTLAGELDGRDLGQYRAVVVSLGRIGEPAAVPTLERLLQMANSKPEQWGTRELITAVALYRCGDPNGKGRATLEWFVKSPHGTWSELATQVLRSGPGKAK